MAVVLVFAGTALVASCSHDWNTYDPRQGASSSSSGSLSSSSSSSGVGGESSSSSSGMAGAGGTGGAGGMSVGGMGGMGGGTTCVPDTGKACYSGPSGTENVGLCKGGATLCQTDGMSYGPCLGEVTPVIEECGTATDEDCDGVINDHCGIWATRAGFALEQRTLGVAADSAGNIVITGRMLGTADFGGGTLTSAGGYDVFVAKYNKDGMPLWSKIFGGATNDEGNAIAVDATGNVFVTGYYTGTMAVGATNLTAVDLQDVFMIKLDSAGAVVDGKSLGGMGNQRGNSITVDSAGNVIVTGTFGTEINTGIGVLNAVNSLDGFVAKYGNNFAPQWHKAFGGAGDDEGYSVVTDATNHIYITGYFDDTIDFGGGIINDGGGLDVFVAKLDATGGHVSSKGFPALGNQYGTSVATDAMGNIFLHGDFDTEIDMGGGKVASAGLSDAFVTKLDSTGAHVFSKIYGDPLDQFGKGMSVDKNGDMVFTIAHEGTVDYGGGPAIFVGTAGSSDVVVVKLKGTTGAHVWSRRFGNASDQDPRCIATDSMNNVFVGGEFGGSMNFGTVTITSNSSDDAYLFKLAP